VPYVPSNFVEAVRPALEKLCNRTPSRPPNRLPPAFPASPKERLQCLTGSDHARSPLPARGNFAGRRSGGDDFHGGEDAAGGGLGRQPGSPPGILRKGRARRQNGSCASPGVSTLVGRLVA